MRNLILSFYRRLPQTNSLNVKLKLDTTRVKGEEIIIYASFSSKSFSPSCWRETFKTRMLKMKSFSECDKEGEKIFFNYAEGRGARKVFSRERQK